MSKKDIIVENLQTQIRDVFNNQELVSKLKLTIKEGKENIGILMSRLGIDEYTFDSYIDKTKNLKALKYKAVKLEIKSGKEDSLIDYLEITDMEKAVDRKVNMKKIEQAFEEGDLSLEELKKFVTTKETEVLKVQEVKK
jgi:hypothetical protein